MSAGPGESTISFVYFDLDDTLLDHKGAERQALANLYHRYPSTFGGVELPDVHESYHEVNIDVWHRYGAGKIDKQRAKLERFELLLAALHLDGRTDAEELSDYYMTSYADYWAWIPRAREAFHRIAEAMPVGIVTNGFTEIQSAKFRQFPEIVEVAKAIVVSEEVGYMKPDPRIFEHATRLVGCEPNQILYVGDSLRSDVQGGQGAGWQVAWYTTESQELPGVFRFAEWKDLLSHLRISSG